MDQNKHEEEKKQLQTILKGMSQKTESERNLEIMKLLHEYNSVKDAAQVVIGALANVENATVKEIHEKFDLNYGD